MTETPDPRLNAFRPDLADARLRDRVAAPRFVDGVRRVVIAPVADLRNAPTPDAGLDTQVLRGDIVRVFDEIEGWAWVQAERDGYVGYTSADSLTAIDAGSVGDPYLVRAPRTFVYAEPDLKRPVIETLSIGALVHVVDTIETRGTAYARLPNDLFCVSTHLRPPGEPAVDPVSVAETLTHTPYLWGGTSGFGIDCSGLVQLSMRMSGRDVPRDTDMQAATVGDAIDPAAGLRRGDLVFWDGHVGIMRDADLLLHANGHAMAVTSEPLELAIDRTEARHGSPTVFRRP